jgi:Right handed beta helix region
LSALRVANALLVLALAASVPAAATISAKAGASATRPAAGFGPRMPRRWKPPTLRSCRGVRVSAAANIQRAIDRHRNGTTFCIGRGVHRLSRPLIAKSGDRFIGVPGAVLNGSRRVIGFRRVGNSWRALLPGRLNPAVVGRCSPQSYHGCQLANDVYYDDRALVRVLDAAALRPGAFFVDPAASQVAIGSPPNGHKVEFGVAARAWEGVGVGSYDVTIRNLTIEKFANEAQVGAVNAGRGWVVTGNEVRLNHGGGIANATITRDNYVHDNGQIGVGGNAPNLRVERNEISFNNYARFCSCWESGGGKWSRATNLRIRANLVHDNVGPGLWTDFGNANVLYDGNVVRNNTGPGIFHEASFAAIIRRNVVERNGFSWGGWLEGAGILVSSSPHVDIYANIVTDNHDGIGITQWDRGSDPAYGPREVRDVTVHGNRITMRHGFTGLLAGTGDPSYYSDRNNRFEGNTYYLGCNQRYFVWRGTGSAVYAALTAAEWRRFQLDTAGRFHSICRRQR